MPEIIPDAMDDEEVAEMRSLAGSNASAPGALYSRSSPSSHGSIGRASSLPTHYSGHESDISLKRDREREGRCADCGVQTHEWRQEPNGQLTKVPLTVENEVHRGRCLLCHPFFTAFNSMRSINTVSSCGNTSVHSDTHSMAQHAYGTRSDFVDSNASVVSSSRTLGIEESLATLEQGADLCDVLAAMRRHPHDPRVQEKGCEKLWIQSWDDENSAAIGRVGGITTILEAMRIFPELQHLQQCGCESLQNLALNDYNRDVIVENGGIGVIVRAMNVHRGVAGVQQCGCSALANLAMDNAAAVVQGHAISSIVAAARSFEDEDSVVSAAYQALRAIGYDPNPQAQQQQQQQQVPAQVSSSSQALAPQQQAPRQDPPAMHQQQPPPQPPQPPPQQDAIRLDQYGFPINPRR